MATQVVDVTAIAREAGFTCQVFVSEEVWSECVEWDDEDNIRQGYQELDARLWDVLFVPAKKLRCGFGTIDETGGMSYEIYCLLRDKGDQKREADLIKLKVGLVDTGKGFGLIVTFCPTGQPG